MRFGICSNVDMAEQLAKIGYDYVEWSVASNVGTVDDAAFAELARRAESLPVRPEAWNVLLPGSLAVVGPEADHDELTSYLQTALHRVSQLGGEVVVFGSGRSRKIPEGWSEEEAHRQFADACARAGDVAAANGLTIVIEPLNKGETNLVNTVAQGQSVVDTVAHDAIQLLSDLYHVAREKESFDDTAEAAVRGSLKHVHVATEQHRQIPFPGREEALVRQYFEALHRGGYRGRISVEGKWDLVEAAAGLEFMRKLWDEVTE